MAGTVVVSLATIPRSGGLDLGRLVRASDRPRSAFTFETGDWDPPRTAAGHPDLQGVWDFRTLTPLQRPRELAGRDVLTDAEAAAYEREARADRENRAGGVSARSLLDRGENLTADRRTSLIVDPPTGRIPRLTSDAYRRASDRAAALRRPARGPEDRNLVERCLVGLNAGPPMNPGVYNNNVQLFQTDDYVALLTEMIHDVRIIPLDDRPRLPEDMRLWKGDSRGSWEGNTLVVETTNFNDRARFRGSSANMHLVERFTRVGADTLLYQYTIDDAASFVRPWSVEVPMSTAEGPMFEYACHEGNYGLANMLSAARAEEG